MFSDENPGCRSALPEISVVVALSRVEYDADDGVSLLHELILCSARRRNEGASHRVALDSGANKRQIAQIVGLADRCDDIALSRETGRGGGRLRSRCRCNLGLVDSGRVRLPSVGEVSHYAA